MELVAAKTQPDLKFGDAALSVPQVCSDCGRAVLYLRQEIGEELEELSGWWWHGFGSTTVPRRVSYGWEKYCRIRNLF